MLIKLAWSDFKSAVTANNLSVQYVSADDSYTVYTANGSFELHCLILKTSPANADQTDFETNFMPSANKPLFMQASAFAAKTVGAKKLFARNTGMQFALSSGANTCNHTISYPWVKLIGAEIINGEALDYIDFEIYDTAAGTYSGIPNYKLNQFGFSVNISPNFYSRECPYDADLYQGMILRMTYNSVSAKTIGINLVMNEVK